MMWQEEDRKKILNSKADQGPLGKNKKKNNCKEQDVMCMEAVFHILIRITRQLKTASEINNILG